MPHRWTRTPARLLFGLCALLALAPARAGHAQATNLSTYQSLLLRCLAAVPDTLRTLEIAAPAQMPYLRAALVQQWQEEGRTLYLPDSSGPAIPPGRARLAFDVEAAAVAYARAPGRRVARTVTLALHYTLTDASGRLLQDERCRETAADTLTRTELATVETPGLPETTAEPPEAGWIRRYLEPAVLTAATAVGVYLFFSLRSRAASTE